MNMPLVLLNRRRRGAFSPAALFALAEPGTWYDPSDLTTLFQDSAGTTPVTGPNQQVGLMLDKSQGLVLGSELKGTGATGIIGVATAATYNTTTGAATCLRVDASNQSYVTITGLSSAATYVVTVTCASAVVGMSIRAGSYSAAAATTLTAGQTKTVYVTGTTAITFTDSGAGCSFTVTSVKLLAGNHAAQATSTQRPIYGINPITGTRNLLTYTEQFDNAAWVKTNATVTANTSTSPDGTSTADTITASAGAGYHYVGQRPTIVVGLTYTLSMYVKAGTTRYIGFGDAGDASWHSAYLDTTNGAILNQTNCTATATDVGSGWFRVVSTFTRASAGYVEAYVGGSDATNNTAPIFTAVGTETCIAWGAQLEVGSTATAYQKVVTQYEVTEAGVQSASYLAFDGVDDGMVTNTITPATDKAQIFAGVRKFTGIGMLVELSAAIGSNAGLAFESQTTGEIVSTGPVGARSYASWTNAQPSTSVFSVCADRAGAAAAAEWPAIRRNGVQVSATYTLDGGSVGNFGAFPLYIGRRGGASLPYNGRLYSLIVRFGANLTTGQITANENWVNSKTGAY